MKKYFHKNQNIFLQDLITFLKFKSISTLPEYQPEIQRTVSWLKKHLQAIGLNNIQELRSPKGQNPILFGEYKISEKLPTILIFGHYDVQPEGDLDAWLTPPFKPTIKRGNIYARGSTDNKGQLFTNLLAIEYYIKRSQNQPVNVKVLIEGEEETDSSTVSAIIRDRRYQDLLSAEYALISDGAFIKQHTPSVTYSLRGLLYFDLIVKGPKNELHSGIYGNLVTNPANAASAIAAKLKDVYANKILIPNIYEDIRKLSLREKQTLEKASLKPKDIARNVKVKQLSIPQADLGQNLKKDEFNSLILQGALPALDINGLYSGFIREGVKTSIPSYALVKFSIRTVPYQEPEKIINSLEEYIDEITPNGITTELKIISQDDWYINNIEDPTTNKVKAAYKAGFGKEPSFVLDGMTIPVVALLDNELAVKSLLMNYGLPDDNLHGPNEKYALDQLEKGFYTTVHFLENY